MLASHGYVVLLPNPRGSAGQGNEFARGVKDGWGSKDYQDGAAGIDMLGARKSADPSRLGIGGWRFGGFMSAWGGTPLTEEGAIGEEGWRTWDTQCGRVH